jgi:hypothetical protein
MALVHRLFRLIGVVEPGQRARVNQVAGHLANVFAALHHHHMAEDERLWPILHARIPLRSNDIQRMQSEHAFIAKSVAIVELLLADWVAATRAHISELATVTCHGPSSGRNQNTHATGRRPSQRAKRS